MKLSLEWLREYVDLPADLDMKKLSYDLTMSTVEVEETVDLGAQFEHVILARIIEAKKHPEADRLNVCQVDCGGGEISEIVCGATNVTENMLVALAKPGSQVRLKGSEECITLKATKIRGVKSNGMLCAAAELGLAELLPEAEDMQIMNLNSLAEGEPKLGQPIADFLGLNDILIDIDNKSLTNRPDLWSHYGMARELASIYKTELKPLELVEFPAPDGSKLSVSIENPELSARYIGVLLDNIKNGPAPYWMQKRLHTVGQRPINLLVDLTNYVMFAVGQPLHVFDKEKLNGTSIYVRDAKSNESIELLDDTSLDLKQGELVIADEKSPQALAGVMGGSETSAENETTCVLLEAASFEPINVRRTSSRLGKRSESSMRFEKGVDRARAEIGSRYYMTLLKSIQSDVNFICSHDEYLKAPEAVSISVTHDFILSRIGEQISSEQVEDILQRLGFGVSRADNKYELTVPEWRATGDVSIPEDIVEEVARMYGYDNLNFHAPQIVLDKAVIQPKVELEHQLRQFLSSEGGMHEIFSYPWAELRYLEATGFDPDKCLHLADAPSDQHRCIVPSLIPNMLLGAKQNLRHFQSFALYELCHVVNTDAESDYSMQGEKLPEQTKLASGVVVDNDEQLAFFRLKGILESAFSELRSQPVQIEEAVDIPAWLASGAAMKIISGKNTIGHFGLVNRSAARTLGFEKASIALFEFNFDALTPDPTLYVNYEKLPQFPVVDYDLAVLFDSETRWEKIQNCALKSHKLIKKVEFLEEYRGKQIPDNKKSISFQLTLQDEKSTLTSDQIDSAAKKVLKQLANNLGGELRSE